MWVHYHHLELSYSISSSMEHLVPSEFDSNNDNFAENRSKHQKDPLMMKKLWAEIF